MVTVWNGEVTARPIGVVGDEEFNGSLWFITDKRSRKVAAIESGATTTLLFQNDKNGDYLQLTGRASVVEDRARLEQLYTTLQRTWFPKGLDDPDITLVRFDADGGNYWDSHDSYVRLARRVREVDRHRRARQERQRRHRPAVAFTVYSRPHPRAGAIRGHPCAIKIILKTT